MSLEPDRPTLGEPTLGRLVAGLDPGSTTLVSVNRRLARAAAAAHDAAREAAGEGAWRALDAVPMGAWLRRLWRRAVELEAVAPLEVAGEAASLALWERAVVEGAPDLVDTERTAELAREGWRALELWGEGVAELAPGRAPAHEEARALEAWARAYRAECEARGWIDPAVALGRLAGVAARLGPRLAGPRVVVAGFDVASPAETRLWRALAGAGVRVEPWSGPCVAPSRLAASAHPDPGAELAAAARWARDRLAAGLAPVGLVVPDLAARRAEVARVLEEALVPAARHPGGAARDRPFAIAAPAPLAGQEPVRTAVLALALVAGRLGLAEAGELLRSPFLAGGAGGAAALARARVEARLRSHGRPDPGPGDVLRAVREAGGEPVLERALAAARRRLGGAPRRQGAAAWAALAAGLLEDLGWPGDRPRSSAEQQVCAAWRELLGAYAGLGPVLAPATFAEAAARIARLAARESFAPRGPEPPLRVLGVLETAGLDFAALRVVGLDDGSWPAAPSPNPFVPLPVARRLGLPRCDARRELDFARRVTGRLARSAPEVVLTCALAAGEERRRPSALVAALAEVETVAGPAAAPWPRTWIAARAAGAAVLETIRETHGPRLGDAAPSGGAALLSDQAACPFRAFAVHRLGAVDARAADWPLDPRLRGRLGHALLERLWSGLPGREALEALGPQGRAARAAEAAGAVLDDLARYRRELGRGPLAGALRGWLEALGRAWLEAEREREDFEVHALEREASARLGGLELRLRLDRVDRLGDGSLVVTDYKLGDPQPGAWFGERPDAPQVPLYVTALEAAGERVAGAAFGRLRSDRVDLAGLGARDGIAPGVVAPPRSRIRPARALGDWAAVKESWRAVLERLAGEAVTGDARVAPKLGRRTCERCAQAPLCRVDASRLAGGGETGSDPGGGP